MGNEVLLASVNSEFFSAALHFILIGQYSMKIIGMCFSLSNINILCKNIMETGISDYD